MATRVVEGKKPYTGGDAIDINQNKVISLKLRDENNLIIYDSGDDEIYVDLQLADGIEPTDAFPVGVTTGRVLVADEWDKTGTLICAKTTSGDNIKLLYADDGTLWIDNGTGTFKQIYLSTDIATILTDYATKEYVDAHDTVISSTEPEEPYEGMIWYNTTSDKLKVYNGASWQDIGSGGGGSSYTAGYGIDIDANDEISVDTSEIATQSDLSSKQDELVSGTNIKTINNESLLGSGDITISGGGADIEYKTQAEYDALPSSKLTDGKHYVIYTADTPTPPTPGRQPGANTIAYFPLENDSNEASGKSVTTSDTDVSYSTLGGVKCANTGINGGIAVTTGILDGSSLWEEQTISFWLYLNVMPGGTSRWAFEFEKLDSYSLYFLARSNDVYRYEGVNAGDTIDVSIPSTDIGTWVYFTLVNSSTGKYMYKNGVQVGSGTGTSRPRGNWANSAGQKSRILCDRDGPSDGESINGGIRELILENKVRTAQEIADYFDLTKGDYGIS